MFSINPKPAEHGDGSGHGGTTCMTYEQKLKIQDWMNVASTGLAVHQEAETRAEFAHFYCAACPTMVLSALATIISSGGEEGFPNLGISFNIVMVIITALNTVLLGIANYWKWSAKAERHRFAAHEYDSLYQRLTIYKSQMEMGEVSYAKVLKDIESAIGEVKKQCGPPPRHLVSKYEKERAMADVENARILEKAREDTHMFTRLCELWNRCWGQICCRRKRSKVEVDDDRTIAMRMIDRKLQDLGRETGAKDMDSFGLDFWLRFRLAAEKHDFDLATSLLNAVPASITDQNFVAYDPNQRSALHHAVTYGFWDLLTHLLQTSQAWHGSLLSDSQNLLAIQCVEQEDLTRPAAARLLIASFKCFCANETVNFRMGEQLTGLLNCVQKILDSGKALNMLRDEEGFGLAHIAAEYDQGDIVKKLLRAPYFASPFEKISIAPDKHSDEMLMRWRQLGVLHDHPDHVLNIAICKGSSSAVEQIFSYMVHKSELSDEIWSCLSKRDEGSQPHVSHSHTRKARVTQLRVEPAVQTASQQLFAWDLRGANSDASGRLFLDWIAKELLKVAGIASHPLHKLFTIDELESAAEIPVVQNVIQAMKFFYQSDLAKSLENVEEFDALESSIAFLRHCALPSSEIKLPKYVERFSLLHYACAFGHIRLVKALLVTNQPWTKDGFGMTPYDYALLRIRALHSDTLKTKVMLDGMLLAEAQSVLCLMTQYAADIDMGHQTEGLLKREKPNKVWEEYKQFKGGGVCLHWACALGDVLGLRSIIAARSRDVTVHIRESRLGLTQCFSRDRFRNEDGDGSSGGRSDGVLTATPVVLAIVNDNKEALRQLLIAAMREGHSELDAVLSEIANHLEESGVEDVAVASDDDDDRSDVAVASDDDDDRSDKLSPQMEKTKKLFQMLFSFDEVSKDFQDQMSVPLPIKAISDYSYLVSVPCNHFTCGCEQHSKTRGKYYYEIKFDDEAACFDQDLENLGKLHVEYCLSLYIGWATDNFAEISKGHVGLAPTSWSFCPWDHQSPLKTRRIRSLKNPVVRLNGQRSFVTKKDGVPSAPLCGPGCGVGVCVDLGSCQIAWRIFWQEGQQPQGIDPDCIIYPPENLKDGYLSTWLLRPSKDGAHVGKNIDDAWNNMGREWMENSRRIFPAISASGYKQMDGLFEMHLSGEFCVPPPEGFLPAVSDTHISRIGEGSSLPIVPLANVQGNTTSQRSGSYQSFSFVHLCALSDKLDLAAKLCEVYKVQYIPMLNCMPTQFEDSVLEKSYSQSDEYSTPYRVAARAGAVGTSGADKLKGIHMKRVNQITKLWKTQMDLMRSDYYDRPAEQTNRRVFLQAQIENEQRVDAEDQAEAYIASTGVTECVLATPQLTRVATTSNDTFPPNTLNRNASLQVQINDEQRVNIEDEAEAFLAGA